jgi:hypothetical protein
VNTAAARYQNLSINQTKLSGQCGRLKCCLNYELDTYMDALKAFPTDADSLETAQGRATLQKRDIFRSLMWYAYSGSNAQYPLSIERVKEIKALNKEGIKPEELGAAEITSERRPGSRYADEGDHGFVNDVGQISLRALERNARARKKKAARKAEGKAQEAPASGNRPQKQGGGKPQTPKPEGRTQQQPKSGGAPQQARRPSQRQEGNPEHNQQQRQRSERRRPPRNRGEKPGGGEHPEG